MKISHSCDVSMNKIKKFETENKRRLICNNLKSLRDENATLGRLICAVDWRWLTIKYNHTAIVNTLLATTTIIFSNTPSNYIQERELLS